MPELLPRRGVIPAIVAAAAIVALVVAAILVVEQAIPAAPAPRGEESTASGGADLKCPDNDPVTQELLSGSTWTMCWRVDASRGLVLQDVHFTPAGQKPVQVLAELSIGQLEVPYDTGLRNTEDITSQGFGGSHMMTLTGTECLGERLETYVPKIGDGSDEGLAATGANVTALIAAMVLLLGAGAVMIKRRREISQAFATAMGRFSGDKPAV